MKTHPVHPASVEPARPSVPRAGAPFVRHALVAAVLALAGTQVAALGLGRLTVLSTIGEPLQAEIDITSLTPEEAAGLRARVASADAYRAAGVDYNVVLDGAQVSLVRRADGRSFLRVTGDRTVQEPFVDVILDLSWGTGRLTREYTLLIDPPGRNLAAAPPAPQTAPALSPPPAPRAPSPAPAPRAAAAPPARPAPTPAPEPAPRAPAAAASAAQDSVLVRRGDTLSGIAAREMRPGVSLDQMLVSLYRANPQAFVGSNMNRLRAGVVLSVPSTEAAQQVPAGEARQLIVAQSADFAAYRQRLAGVAPTVPSQGSPQQASGTVRAQVDDRKAGAASAPDRLQLSQGGVRASAPEAQVSRDARAEAERTRVAELSRSIAELRQLAPAASKPAPSAKAPTPAPVPAPAKPAASAAVPAPAPIVAAAPPPSPPPPPPPPPPIAAAPASLPATPAVSAEPPAVLPGPSIAASVPAKPRPPVATPAPAADDIVTSVLNSPYLMPAAGGLLALLGVAGLIYMRRRQSGEGSETSFLESKLQPDSFFGASGGQRVDTSDSASSGAPASSSLNYSLSQLDAIGDVDPVAEADVYLAYGRDLQAEEILKEALRSDPSRLAIRMKLLEVYAKRADGRAYEVQARDVMEQTRGMGDEWLRAQETGRQLDPENPLYRPGIRAEELKAGADADDDSGEATVAQTVPQFAAPTTLLQPETVVDSLDLDLDLTDAPVGPGEVTQPMPVDAMLPDLEFPLDDEPAPRPGTGTGRGMPQATDLGDFDLDPPTLPIGGMVDDLPDLGGPPKAAPGAPTPPVFDFGDLSLDLDAPSLDAPAPATGPADPLAALDDGDADDPLARKVELADEFRRIGDLEGARDLLEEVVAKAQGSMKARAQGMLDSLG